MPLEIWNVEWPNVNSQRAFPLMEGQSLQDGEFTLPNDLLVDLTLSVNISQTPVIDLSKFHLAQVGIFSSGVVLSFAYDGSVFATVNIPIISFAEYSSYVIQGIAPFFDSYGWVTIGKIATALKTPGAWNFTADTARLAPTTLRPSLRAFSSINVVNNTDRSPPLQGDVLFEAGRNFRFRVNPATNTVYFDAIDGSEFNEECDCNNLDLAAPPIRTVNGVAPNDAGELSLRGTSCVSIVPSVNALVIEDLCSEPCCDCRELEVVMTTLDSMLGQLQTLEMVAERLDNVIQNVQGTILASKTTGIPR